MVDTCKLKAAIALRSTTQRKVAAELGITDKTFYVKMKKGVFNSNEISKMIELLSIDNPIEIFFAKQVS